MFRKSAEATGGSISIVGIGIALGQPSAQCIGILESADVAMTLVTDTAAQAFLVSRCKTIIDLLPHYTVGRHRSQIYAEIAENVMSQVREGLNVCMVLYGHPGLLATPAHLALKLARKEGYPSQMLAAISSEDCMFADLGIDPFDHGLQSHEAGAFLRKNKVWDPSSNLVLWQIAAVGDDEHHEEYPNKRLPDLITKLTEVYGCGHEVIVYEAATLPLEEPRIDRVKLADLATTHLTTASTLLILPIMA